MAGGVHGRGVHGKRGVHGRGACVAPRHAWQRGDMCDRVVCMVGGGGVRGRYYEIRSMSGRYASYWNAFLLFILNCHLQTVC